MAVRKTICGRSFFVVDPATYPYANGCFDEEEPIHADWCAYGDGNNLVDVGACFGSYTLPALAAGATVIAFEPSDAGARILEENVRLNGWQERCTIVRRALFDGGAYPNDLHASVFGESYPAKDVSYSTLDAEVNVRVDAIKIDVEGGELGVLQGGAELIRKHRPVIFIEDHDGINPGHIVSDYPASVQSRKAITSLIRSLEYKAIAQRLWDCNRSYLMAIP